MATNRHDGDSTCGVHAQMVHKTDLHRLLTILMMIALAVTGAAWGFVVATYASKDSVNGLAARVVRTETDMRDIRGEMREMRSELNDKLDRLLGMERRDR